MNAAKMIILTVTVSGGSVLTLVITVAMLSSVYAPPRANNAESENKVTPTPSPSSIIMISIHPCKQYFYRLTSHS